MSFALLSLYFLAGSVLLLFIALWVRRISLRTVAPALGIALLALVLLTAIFDNVMIGSGLFAYAEKTLLGVRVGLAPLEDFSYPVSVVFFAPALWWLAGGRPPGTPAPARSVEQQPAAKTTAAKTTRKGL
ncbi:MULTISPECIES: lycopene cyclase domain-containing protein [Arthrobacter]|uniref:lycopene cyclase domain-containing protein n=1 Tax=Arthrobacter TaxID=1663 RepID=UPI00339A1CF5